MPAATRLVPECRNCRSATRTLLRRLCTCWKDRELHPKRLKDKVYRPNGVLLWPVNGVTFSGNEGGIRNEVHSHTSVLGLHHASRLRHQVIYPIRQAHPAE